MTRPNTPTSSKNSDPQPSPAQPDYLRDNDAEIKRQMKAYYTRHLQEVADK